MNGFLLVNKPAGLTSYDIIRKIKHFTPPKTKIGHSGTLDPFATGLLIVAIGRTYTRQLDSLINLDKIYQAEITLGKETDSYDIDGKETFKYADKINLTENEIKSTIQKFTGTIDQLPPIFSAKKINGTNAYKLARKGEKVELKPSKITIYEIQLTEFNQSNDTLNISVHCSKGTYIRSLAYDIGKDLKVGGFLSKLARLSIGNVSIDDAITIDNLSEETIKKGLKSVLP